MNTANYPDHMATPQSDAPTPRTWAARLRGRAPSVVIVFGGLALLYAAVSPLIVLTVALAVLAAVLCFGGVSYRRFVRQQRP